MTDIEHAKKYAEESISLAISMYNPKAEIIAETACLYGLTFKNEQIAELEHKLEQTEKDLADYQFNYPTIKELQKENAELKEQHEVSARNMSSFIESLSKSENEAKKQLTKAKELLKRFIEISNPIYFEEDRQKVKAEAEQFLKEE